MTWWSTGFVGLLAAVTVLVLRWGIAGFNANRARNVKYIERQHSQAVVQRHIEHVKLVHTEITRRERKDRYTWFIIPHIMVFCYAICMFAGAELTSNVTRLGNEARYTMATCFLIGAILVLTGATLGARVGRWVIKADVSDHLTAHWLGDDIVLPYRVEMAGMGAMLVSSSIYSWTSFQSTTGSLGGWLTAGIAVSCGLSVASFYRAVKVFQDWDTTLITEAYARLEAEDDADAD